MAKEVVGRNYADHLDYLEHLPLDVLKAIDGTSQVAQSLERQDLEGELERLNILETPFYDRLQKIQATAYEHEYNVVTSRHDKIGYAAYRDGGIPRTVEVEVSRRRTLPTLLGQRITITELAVATTRAGVQTAEQTARTEKMVAVMEETEYLLFHGDRRFGSTDFSSPQNLQFDGMENIVKRGAPQNVTDLGGRPLSLNALWAAENKVYLTQGLARPNVVFMSPVDKINLQQSFYQIARTNQADRVAGVLGTDAQTYISAYGETELVTNRFLGDWHKYTDLGFGNTGGEFARPAAPVVSVAADGVANNTGTDGLAAGNYQYAVKAANFNGESAAVETVLTDATVGQRITFTLGTIDASTKWFIIYRADNDGDYKFLRRLPYYGGATVVVSDDGHETLVSAYGTFTYSKIPGTGFVAGVDLMTTMVAQWIPLEQVPLPQTLNRDFAIRHVSSLFSRAPEFNFLIVNVAQENVI
jgi:hypothetical protein